MKLRDAIILANKRDNKNGGRHYWDYEGDWGTGRKQPTGKRATRIGKYVALR